MIKRNVKSVLMGPVLMGLVMGPLMLWMAHGLIMGQSGAMAGWALAAFVGAHFLMLGAALFGVRFALRWFPNVKLHRPGARHFALMLGTAIGAALTIHLLHGGAV